MGLGRQWPAALVPIPAGGVALPGRLARTLGVGVGDFVYATLSDAALLRYALAPRTNGSTSWDWHARRVAREPITKLLRGAWAPSAF